MQTNAEALLAAVSGSFPGLSLSLTHLPEVVELRAAEGGNASVMALPGADGPVVVPAPSVPVVVSPARWVLVATLTNPADKVTTVGWTAEGELPDVLAKFGGFAAAVAMKQRAAGVWDPGGALADALGRIV